MAKRFHNFPAFSQPPEVTFGTGSLRTLAALTDLDQTVFFLSAETAVHETLAAALARYEIGIEQLNIVTKPAGEPTWQAVQFGAEFLRQANYRRIIGIGGGSVLDWCRLAWAHQSGLLDTPAGKKLDASNVIAPEFWLIPTTCATGAEAASVAVLTHDGEKRPVVCNAFLASRVILDARFLASLNPVARAQSLADALSHGIESFLSIVPNYLAKEMALAALGSIFEHTSSDEACAGERLLEGAYLGGLAASHCSVGVVHAFAHSVARFGIPHGLANALALVSGIETNREAPATSRLLARLGLASVDELLARIEPIVKTAKKDPRVAPVIAVLKHADDRTALASAIAQDVCLRTNPCPLGADAIEAFLDKILSATVAG